MRSLLIGFSLIAALALGYWGFKRFQSETSAAASMQDRAAPAVEVTDIRNEAIELRRKFSGSLESPKDFIVSPKIGGRVLKMLVDIGDKVEKGQVVAVLEDETLALDLLAAEADLTVAEANLFEAKNDLEISQRDLNRLTSLKDKGFESESAYDNAKAQQLRASAEVRTAEAQISRAQATLKRMNVQKDYLNVKADWNGDGFGVVSHQYVNEGINVSAREPLLKVVDLNPLQAVVYVTEKDYGRLQVGQEAHATTAAYPGERFSAKVARIAPSFSENSRQARIELEVPNLEQRLAPGMFTRIEILLNAIESATVVPLSAIVIRDEEQGVFLLNSDNTVSWRPVKTGIQQGESIQVLNMDLSGKVITLGQQMVSDGAEVTVVDKAKSEATP